MMNKWIDKGLRWLQQKDDSKNTLYREGHPETKKKTLYQRLDRWRQLDVARDPNRTSKFFYQRVWIAIGLLVVGCGLAILMGNLWLMFPLGLGLFSIPFLQASVLEERASYKQIEQEEMSLSVLSGQYLSEESFEKAILSAMPYLEGKVRDEMEWYLSQSRFVNADTNELVDQMIKRAKGAEDELLAEWFLELKKSFADKNIKKELYERVTQVSERRMAKREFQISMEPLKKEFWIMAALVPVSRLIMLVINRDWLDVLNNTDFGKGLSFIVFMVLLVTTHCFFRYYNHDDAIRLGTKKKERITNRQLYRFTKYLKYELSRCRNLPEILTNYQMLASEPLRSELNQTIADMKIGNMEKALLMLDRRVENPTMTDISRGLGAFLQGEVKEAYWQVIERKLLEDERAMRRAINKRRMDKVRGLGLWLLTSVMCMFLGVMLIQIVTELSQMFG